MIFCWRGKNSPGVYTVDREIFVLKIFRVKILVALSIHTCKADGLRVFFERVRILK